QLLNKGLYTVDGMTFGVESYKFGAEQVYNGVVLFFNKSMLEREGLWDDYNLYDMQRNKTWTWDALDEVAFKVTKDKDGDGEVDQYGMIYHSRASPGFNSSNSNGGLGWGWYEVDENGTPVFRGREPERIKVLKYFYDMGTAGRGWFRYVETGSEVDLIPRTEFTSGRAFSIVNYGNAIEVFKEMGMQDTLGVVAVPMGPDNTKREYYVSRKHFAVYMMPRSIEHPRQAARVLYELSRPLYSQEESEVAIEATLADLIGGEEEIIETFKMLSQPERRAITKENPIVATWNGSIASYHGSFPAIIQGAVTPEELNDMYGDQIQTFINDWWGNVLEGAERIKKKREEGKW
ncbi:MAG TPA: ABC transporter substrate-binding protein, partial [Clostridia bacterium]|nr:ABC transporter substrate-binding protein [Clostridia bacterium]